MLEQLDIHMQENKSRPRPYTLHNIKSRWTINLNVKCKTMKHLDDNIGENLYYLRFDNDFLDTISKARSMKEIMHKLGFIKIKNSCSA